MLYHPYQAFRTVKIQDAEQKNLIRKKDSPPTPLSLSDTKPAK